MDAHLRFDNPTGQYVRGSFEDDQNLFWRSILVTKVCVILLKFFLILIFYVFIDFIREQRSAFARVLFILYFNYFYFLFLRSLSGLPGKPCQQFLFLQGSSGLPSEFCQQSTFRRESSTHPFLSTLSSVKKINGHCQIGVGDGGGCPDIRVAIFLLDGASRFFFF